MRSRKAGASTTGLPPTPRVEPVALWRGTVPEEETERKSGTQHSHTIGAFPALRIDFLRKQAKHWAEKTYPDIPIDRIVLYYFASEKFQKHHSRLAKAKYVIVFEYTEPMELLKSTIEHQKESRLDNWSLCEMDEIVQPNALKAFETETEYLCTGVKNYYLIDTTFSDVYESNVPHDFRDEWIFVPKSSRDTLSVRVKMGSGFEPLVLFERKEEAYSLKGISVESEIDLMEGVLETKLPSEIVKVVLKTVSIIEPLYEAMIFHGASQRTNSDKNIEETWKHSALKYFDTHEKTLSPLIKREYLEDESYYDLTPDHTKRDFIGKLLQKVITGIFPDVSRHEYGFKRLYEAYKNLKSTHQIDPNRPAV